MLYALYHQSDHPHRPFEEALRHAAQVIEGLPERLNRSGQPFTMNEWVRTTPNSGWRRMEPRRQDPSDDVRSKYTRLLDTWIRSKEEGGERRYHTNLELKGAGLDITF